MNCNIIYTIYMLYCLPFFNCFRWFDEFSWKFNVIHKFSTSNISPFNVAGRSHGRGRGRGRRQGFKSNGPVEVQTTA